MNLQVDEIQAILQPDLALLGYEWIGMEIITGPHKTIWRMYIDTLDGKINAGQLGEASRQIIDSLRLAGVETETLHFEVSSPGFNRRLFTLAQCEAFIGQVVAVKLRTSISGRQRYKGKLIAIENEQLMIQEEELPIACPWHEIVKAHVIADLSAYLTSEKKVRRS